MARKPLFRKLLELVIERPSPKIDFVEICEQAKLRDENLLVIVMIDPGPGHIKRQDASFMTGDSFLLRRSLRGRRLSGVVQADDNACCGDG